MRILHIISSLEMGGAQRLLSDVLPMIATKHEVTLLVNREVKNDFTYRLENAGVKIISMNIPNLYSIRNLYAIRNAIRKYDVVHTHLFPTIYWAAFANLFCRTRLIYTEHSTSNRRRGKWYFRLIEKFVYSRYDRIISISEQTQVALKKWLGAKSNDARFITVNNGVNIPNFRNIVWNRTYPYSLIMVSRFAASKDQKTVIRAVALLPKDVHVIFVGTGELIEDCKFEAGRLNVCDRVHFVGNQSNVRFWLAQADIGVQSSNWEGFGLTAVEMMAAGLPVIATNVNGLKQIVEGAGLLFSVGNEKELALHIQKLMTDRSYYNTIALQCTHRATLYDVKITTEKYLNIYNEFV